jgi:hypothetical protein
MYLVGRLSLSLAMIAASLAFTFGLTVSAARLPETPAAATLQPPVAPTPTPFIWPVRYILSGSASARPGDLVSYRVDYEWVADAKLGMTFTLLWTEGAASLVSLTTLSGPEAKIVQPEKRQMDVVFPDAAGPGIVQVTLRLVPDFVGILRVGIEVRGSSITMPEGSVLGVLTSVTPAAQELGLSGTGVGQAGATSHKEIALGLAMAGITALSIGGFACWRNRWEHG